MTHRLPLIASSVLLLFACDQKGEQPTPQPDETTPAKTAARPQPTATATAETTSEPAGEKKASGATLVDPGAEDPQEVTKAIAVLHGLGDAKISGTVSFEQKDGKVKLKTEVEGLPAGKHAYHVHLLGDCSADDGKSAGTHFHFDGPSKKPPKDIDVITGNLGELEPDDAGKASHEAVVDGAKLQGPYSILGRAVIVHEKGNDPEKPPIGAAGGRIACGVIGITE